MASGTITLLDLPSKPPRACWSFNPWKTRFLLNYKGLDYKTEWVEYSELKTRLENHLPANKEGSPYTIPTVIFPDGTYLSDSRKIADAIEQKHPNPPVHLDSPYHEKVNDALGRVLQPIPATFLAAVPRVLLNEASLEYWYRTRKAWVGMDVDQFEKEKGGESAWDAAAPAIQEMTALLKENADGPFFMGATVSYADFVWAGFLEFTKRLGEDVLNQVLKRSGDAQAHSALMEAVSPWSKRNSY